MFEPFVLLLIFGLLSIKDAKKYWEDRAIHPFSGTDETRSETKYDVEQQKFIRSLVHNSSSCILKTDLWNEGIRKGIFDVNLFKNSFFVGIDISKEVCKKAKSKHDWIQTINSDIKFLPFKENTFNTLLDLSTSDHVKFTNFQNCIQQYSRILKPQGELILMFNKFNLMQKFIQVITRKLHAYTYCFSYDFHPFLVKKTIKKSFLIVHSRSYGKTFIRCMRKFIVLEKIQRLGILHRTYLIKGHNRKPIKRLVNHV